MKNNLFILALFLTPIVFSQTEDIKLTNALVVGKLDKQEDRYSIEINLTELLTDKGVKAIPSLNVMKFGSDASLLSSDSIQKVVTAKGIDTYILVSVRGYDKKFKRSTKVDDLGTALNVGNLFPIYRGEVTSVSFEFQFFRNGQFIGSDIIKCGNVSDRNGVIKKFRKKVSKRIVKKWKL